MFHYKKENNNSLNLAVERNVLLVRNIVHEHGFASVSECGFMEYFTKGIRNSDYKSGYDMTCYTVSEGHNEVDMGYWYLAHELRMPTGLLEPSQEKILAREVISTIVEINLHELKKSLLEHRLRNYGYDVRSFRKLANKASFYRNKLRNMYKGDLVLNCYGLSRVCAEYNGETFWGVNALLVPNAVFHYVVGQSFNEEYIRLLQQLSDHK